MSLRIADFENGGAAGRCSVFLRMDRRVEALYEAENREARVAWCRVNVMFGLLLSNLFNFSDPILIPDTAPYSIFCRLVLITPPALVALLLANQTSAAAREWLFSFGMLASIAVPFFAFAFSDAPLANYTFAEHTLVLIFANMLAILRFPQAVAFTVGSFIMGMIAIELKSGLDLALYICFVLHLVVSCSFALYCNYLFERRRCRSFLAELVSRLRSEEAEAERREFQGLSLTDSLTGLPNRRALDLDLARFAGEDESLAVMMIDVDHFKLYNDRLGHPAGDACLRAIAAALREVAEGPDVAVARFGGEEFTLVLRGANQPETERVARRIVTAVMELGVEHPARRDGLQVVTVSVGVACKPAGSRVAWESVLAAADRALYAAKSHGRNRWIVSEISPGPMIAAE